MNVSMEFKKFHNKILVHMKTFTTFKMDQNMVYCSIKVGLYVLFRICLYVFPLTKTNSTILKHLVFKQNDLEVQNHFGPIKGQGISALNFKQQTLKKNPAHLWSAPSYARFRWRKWTGGNESAIKEGFLGSRNMFLRNTAFTHLHTYMLLRNTIHPYHFIHVNKDLIVGGRKREKPNLWLVPDIKT